MVRTSGRNYLPGSPCISLSADRWRARPLPKVLLPPCAHSERHVSADTPQQVATSVSSVGSRSSLSRRTENMESDGASLSPAMISLVVLQAVALLGSIVTGVLARQRRKQLEVTNRKLRKIAAELWQQRETLKFESEEAEGDRLGLEARRTSLETALRGPSAAHPTEEYGSLRSSLARARRQVDLVVEESKVALREAESRQVVRGVLNNLEEASQTANDIKDVPLQRSVLRLQARAFQQLGAWSSALEKLHQIVDLGRGEMDEGGDDADTLGALGDVYTEMGDLERAAQYYDECFDAIMRSKGK